MKDRRFDEIPVELRDGWQPTPAGQAWVELLGPTVPQDVQRWTPDTRSGVLLSDPNALLAATNSFGAAIEGALGAGVVEPALQVLTSTFFLSRIPAEGDCLMFFCYRGSETAEVVAWNHETGEFYGPLAYDLPTALRLVEVAASRDSVEARREALRPALGRWARGTFPMTQFERALADDDVWRQADPWPEIEPPKSSFPTLWQRSWWLAGALVNAAPATEQIQSQLDWKPDAAFATSHFQDVPYTALYWLWRTYFLGEDAWHEIARERCRQSQARLVRDAVAYLEDHGADGALAEWRTQATRLRDPFPARVERGPVVFVRDDGLASFEPAVVTPPPLPCRGGQAMNAWWSDPPPLAIPHPDGRRWLVEGHHDHPRRGKHPSIPNTVEALIEVDPATGTGTVFASTQGEGGHTRWGEYLDENRLLVINNGRLRLYERHPAGTGRGYLIDSLPLGQERALVIGELGVTVGHGGQVLWTEQGWQTIPKSISFARIVEGRLEARAVIELALAHLAVEQGQMIGRSGDGKVGYRVEGLTVTPAPDRISFAPSAFAIPEKVWRAGPPTVLEALGPMDVSIESAAGLCLINKVVTDPPGARRAYVGNALGIRPTVPELEMAGYALISPTIGCVVTSTAVHRVDLETGDARQLFEIAPGSQAEAVAGGFVVLSGRELVARSPDGAELQRVDVGPGASIVTPCCDDRVVAMRTQSSPLVLLAIQGPALRLLGAVRPDGDLAGVTFGVHAQPQWNYRLIAKAQDGAMLELRGVATTLAGEPAGVAVGAALPERPWEAGPEIQRR